MNACWKMAPISVSAPEVVKFTLFYTFSPFTFNLLFAFIIWNGKSRPIDWLIDIKPTYFTLDWHIIQHRAIYYLVLIWYRGYNWKSESHLKSRDLQPNDYYVILRLGHCAQYIEMLVVVLFWICSTLPRDQVDYTIFDLWLQSHQVQMRDE